MKQSILHWIATMETTRQRDAVVSLLAGSMDMRPSKSVISSALDGCGTDFIQAMYSLFAARPDKREISALMDALERVPVVRLTLACVPSDGAVRRWHRLLTDAVGKPCVLDISRDRNIAAGAVVEFAGRVYRHTVADEIDAYPFIQETTVR